MFFLIFLSSTIVAGAEKGDGEKVYGVATTTPTTKTQKKSRDLGRVEGFPPKKGVILTDIFFPPSSNTLFVPSCFFASV